MDKQSKHKSQVCSLNSALPAGILKLGLIIWLAKITFRYNRRAVLVSTYHLSLKTFR